MGGFRRKPGPPFFLSGSRTRGHREGAVGLRPPYTTGKAARGDLAGPEPSPAKLPPPAPIASLPPSLQTSSGRQTSPGATPRPAPSSASPPAPSATAGPFASPTRARQLPRRFDRAPLKYRCAPSWRPRMPRPRPSASPPMACRVRAGKRPPPPPTPCRDDPRVRQTATTACSGSTGKAFRRRPRPAPRPVSSSNGRPRGSAKPEWSPRKSPPP